MEIGLKLAGMTGLLRRIKEASFFIFDRRSIQIEKGQRP
jgi:hypothetical protein